MKKFFNTLHIIACIAAMITGWQFLKSFAGHFENGIWDSSAITATALILVMLIFVFLHMTFFLSQYSGSTNSENSRKKHF